MPLSSLMISPSVLAGGALALLAASTLLWLIVRIKQQRLWLPILAIMKNASTPKPQFTWQRPPWVELLCFFLIACLISALALRPRFIESQPEARDKGKAHLFVDLSPSLAAHISLEDYASEVAKLWALLAVEQQVTVATSHHAANLAFNSKDELIAALRQLGFHRGGIDLGSALKKQLAALGDLQLLVIFSDRDAHSWRRFNWTYLKERSQVYRVDMATWGGTAATRPTADAGAVPLAAVNNIFIGKATYLSEGDESASNWDIELERRGERAGEQTGRLSVTWAGETLATVPWQFPKDASTLTLRVSWPLDKLARTASPAASTPPLLWSLQLDTANSVGLAAHDRLGLDNEFRSPVQGRKQEAVLIADMGGEQTLEDPLHQLKVSFEVLGLSPLRHDWLPHDFSQTYRSYPLWVVFVSKKKQALPAFCPLANAPSAAPSTPLGGEDTRILWLAPYALSAAHYQNLCWCYSSLVQGPTAAATAPMPEYCRNINDPAAYAMTLKSLGAQPIGGRVDQQAQAFAWRGYSKELGRDIMSFTIPLQPQRQTGLSHAKLPLLVGELLKAQGLLPAEAPGGTNPQDLWPRPSDLSSLEAWSAASPQASTPDDEQAAEQAREANVPRGESLFQELAATALPPLLAPPFAPQSLAQLQRQEKESPLAWLQASLLLVIALTVLEALWGVWRRLRRPRRPAHPRSPEPGTAEQGAANSFKHTTLVALIGSSLCAGVWAPRASAHIDLAVIGSEVSPQALTGLAEQVAERTSLQLGKQSKSYGQLSDDALTQPWLWVSNPQLIRRSDEPLMQEELVRWIKRGGFLVLEGPAALTELEGLTRGLFTEHEEKASWGPIPPDHELLRSFYLINSLPTCQADATWHGFAFDQRLAILAIPYPFLAQLGPAGSCGPTYDQEAALRVLINTLMVGLTTDYKKDQIHMKEILKRLQ